MDERIPLTSRTSSYRNYPNTDQVVKERGNGNTVDEGSLELLEHLIAIVLQGNTHYLETLLRNDEILEVLDLHDNKGFTALHISSERVDSECVRLLLEADANPNVMDRFRRTALHWVVSGGCHCDFCDSKRARCTELLLRAKANLEIKDVKDETPLSYAAKHMFQKAAQTMIDHGAEINQICNGVTTTHLIVEKIPNVMIQLLDQSVAYDQDDNSKFKIDFKLFLDSVPTTKKKDLKASVDEVDDETPKRRRPKGRKEMELLNSFLTTSLLIRESLLTHPVTEAFLYLKWTYVRKWFWFIRTLYSALTLVYTYFIFNLYVVQCPYLDETDRQQPKNLESPKELLEDEQNTLTTEIPKVENLNLNHCKPSFDLFIIGICIGSWLGLILVTTIYTAAHSCKLYFTTGLNIGWWIFIGSITLTILPVFGLGILQDYWHWQYILAAFGVFYAWAMNLSYLSQIPLFGAYVEMLTKVLRRLAIVLIAYSSLFFAFTFGFCVLFPKVSYFKQVPTAISRIFMMMVGQWDYATIFNSVEETRLDNIEYWTATHIYYIGFIIVFGIVMMNLLMALAVNDVSKLQRTAELAHVSRQIVGITLLESMVSDNWIANCIQKHILSEISVQCRNGHYFRFSPLDPKDRSLPDDIKSKFIPLLHNRDCLNRREILQRPLRSLSGQSTNHNGVFHRNDPVRSSNHSQQRIYTRTPTENIDEILNELKLKLEGLQRRRILSNNQTFS